MYILNVHVIVFIFVFVRYQKSLSWGFSSKKIHIQILQHLETIERQKDSI